MLNSLSNTLLYGETHGGSHRESRGLHNRLPNFQRLCAQQTQLGIRELDIQFALFLVEQEQALSNRDGLSRDIEGEIKSEALDALALHRMLKLRISDYDYDQHIGGGYYLFLRAMRPNQREPYGQYFHKPDRALIEALDQLISDPLFNAPETVQEGV